MAKVKLVFIFFSIINYCQDLSLDSNDLIVIEKLGDSLSQKSMFHEASIEYEKLVKIKPNNFNFNYKYSVAYGANVQLMSRFQQAKHVKGMINKFETALKLNKNHLGLNFALLEIYLKVPRFLGGGKKKAFSIVNNIDSISKKEGDLAKKMYDDF